MILTAMIRKTGVKRKKNYGFNKKVVCNVNSNVCVECTDDFQCPDEKFCFLNYGTCVECFSDDHCNVSSDVKHVCVNFQCVTVNSTGKAVGEIVY
jgi:hypothetical protein